MDSADPVTIGAVAVAGITLANGLTSVIKMLVEKILKKEKPAAAHMESGSRVEKKIDRLVDWHDARDVNGIPLGYFPRTLIEDQKEIAVLLRETAEINRRLMERLETHDENMQRGFDEVRRDVARLGK